jgi:putative heme-binding domain-containing protein
MVEDKKNKEVLQFLILDKNYGAEGRMAAIRAMGKDWSGEDRLFALAKDHKLSPDLEAIAATVLSNSNRDAMRRSAAKYLKGAAPAVENTIAPIKELVAGKGDPAAGSTVFMSYCSVCHQVNQKGVHFGPDLSEIGSKLSKEALYAAVLKPSEGISFGFEGFTFKLKNGSTLLGYVESQTDDEITIKMIGGQSEKHKKSEILEKKDYGQSLMPEGLPQAMGQQKFVDLVEYLSALKKK